MQPQRLIRYRPWLYHLTSRENLAAITAERRLGSAARLLEAAGRIRDIRERRLDHRIIETRDERRLLRDQRPLHEGNIEFEAGWDFGDVVALLNRHVFFWPGTEAGPSEYGVRHFKRYRSEGPILLRMRTEDLLGDDIGHRVKLCAFNSGAPRCSGGRKSPRGRDTFLPLAHFPDRVSDVVEVVVEDDVRLLGRVEVADHPQGPYAPL